MKKSKGQREENSGSIWLACLKVMAVLFAAGLFSTAIWFRQRQYNPQEFGVDDLTIGSSGVSGDGRSIKSDGKDSGGEGSRLAFSGSKQLAIPPGEFTFTQPGTTSPPDEFTIDLDLSPEVVEFEGFIHYGSPIDLSKNEPATADPPALLISGSKSIAMPIFSTRSPRAGLSSKRRVLMSSSKLGLVLSPAEANQWVTIGGETVRVVPPKFDVRLEGLIHSNLSQFSAPGYLQAPADSWPAGWHPAGNSTYGDTIPTGFRISIDPSVVAPPFLTIPDPDDDLRIQMRESVVTPD